MKSGFRTYHEVAGTDRSDLPGHVDVDAGVLHPRSQGALLPEATEDELDVELLREPEEPREEGSRRRIRDLLGDLELAGLGAEIGEALRQDDETRAFVSTTPDHPFGGGAVGLDVPGGGHLYDPDPRPLTHAAHQKLKRLIETFINKPMPTMIVNTLDPP